ncbi:type II toxin-antitoxin system Phd/YefM family antitoxin [Mannheimia sp. HC-2023]|uniref:type II toxin-antitoxin system Phd/YefM family antitoxin n=1 Tax=Mannheimia indoligenes TaxID=3103145 RepID=UPI002FE55D8E
MPITMTSREFNQHASKVLKMAEKEPVFITKWGKIVSVVSSYVDYQQSQKTQTEPSFAQLFSAKENHDVISNEAFEDFDRILADVRKNSRHRPVEFDE